MSDGSKSNVPETGAQATFRPDPIVNPIGFTDIIDAFRNGLADFRAAPQYGLAIGAFFWLGGLAIILTAATFNMSYLSYPLAAGFVLVGPFACAGLYEVSRRLEQGLPLSWHLVLKTMWLQKGRELSWMAFVVLFIQIMWMYQIRLLLAVFLGFQSFASFQQFLHTIISTPDGLMFLLIGHIVGAMLSLVLFSVTVISFPLLMERDRDFITAMITSLKAVALSPVPILGWGLVVTVVLILALLPAFAGLLLALPILGHTTWHLYRRCVGPEVE